MLWNFQPASVDAVYQALLSKARPINEEEEVPLLKAMGRILAKDIVSNMNVPPYDNSAMDGYAIRVSDGMGPLPVDQVIAAGDTPKPLKIGTAARIFTGAPVPVGADSIVVQEKAIIDEKSDVTFTEQPVVDQHIRLAGEDIFLGQKVLEARRPLDARALALMASLGLATCPAIRRLKVALFFTGDELIEPGEPLLAHRIYNANRYWLHTSLILLGCDIVDMGIVPDDVQSISQALLTASQQADVVLTCGGVSVGDKDYVKEAVVQLGELFLWKVAMKPGKPFAFGCIGEADFMGLPGNPVSGFVSFELLAKPFLLARLGIQSTLASRFIPARSAFERSNNTSVEEFCRVQQSVDDQGQCLKLYPNQSSGAFFSCVWADGVVRIRPNQSIKVGDVVDFLPWRALVD